MLRIGDREFPDCLVLGRSLDVADQGGRAGADAGNSPAIELMRTRGTLDHTARNIRTKDNDGLFPAKPFRCGVQFLSAVAMLLDECTSLHLRDPMLLREIRDLVGLASGNSTAIPRSAFCFVVSHIASPKKCTWEFRERQLVICELQHLAPEAIGGSIEARRKSVRRRKAPSQSRGQSSEKINAVHSVGQASAARPDQAAAAADPAFASRRPVVGPACPGRLAAVGRVSVGSDCS
jgi:hypothetical protein